MTPGLTGIGSIVFRDEEGIISRSSKGHEACYEEDIAPLKAKLEIWYSEHQSLWLDLELIFLTAWIVVFPNSRIYRRLLGSEWDNELDALIGT
jgi:lipopolysaccharide/colanic/teichoic acid biosynthesis glycosyltransferase